MCSDQSWFTNSDLWRHLMFWWAMTIIEPKKENHVLVCLSLLVTLLVPPAAPAATAATSWASAGGGWDIGDGDGDTNSFMVARTHIAQQSASHPLQNDKESGTTITLKLVHCKIIQLVFFLQPHLNRTPIFMSHLRNMYFMRKELRHYQNLFILMP